MVRLRTPAYEHCTCVTRLLNSASFISSCMPQSITTRKPPSPPSFQGASMRWRSCVRTASRRCRSAVAAQCIVLPSTKFSDSACRATRWRSRRRRRRAFHTDTGSSSDSLSVADCFMSSFVSLSFFSSFSCSPSVSLFSSPGLALIPPPLSNNRACGTYMSVSSTCFLLLIAGCAPAASASSPRMLQTRQVSDLPFTLCLSHLKPLPLNRQHQMKT
mmetsp:Transcript_27427/g.68695  ORF Transcript_27427/g.68695 Transcript_27427/m.68695 type:complete len:216 (+) Transcript_27427:1412-2059(+)